jgi:AcrR family transcriptional regulator
MKEGTKDRLLTCARDLFLEQGPEAVSMRAIAREAGLTPMAIYRHFENRRALLRAVIDKGFDIFMSYLQRSLALPTPWERLWYAGRQYLCFALEHPHDYAVMFMESHKKEGRKDPGNWQEAATFRFLVDRIRECIESKILTAGDSEEMAATVWAQCHGLVSLYLAGKLGMTERAFRDLYARSLALITFGLAGPEMPPPDILNKYTM